MIRCIISDLGNVLISFDNDIFFEKISQSSPFSAEEIKRIAHENRSLAESFDRGLISPDEFYRDAGGLLHSELNRHDFFRIYNDVFTSKPVEIEILTRLKDRFRMVMLSNTDCMRYGFIESNFPETQFFDAYVLSYLVGSIKPDSEIFHTAVIASGVDAGQCVFIDDREENILAARKLGFQTVHFPNGSDLESALGKHHIMD